MYLKKHVTLHPGAPGLPGGVGEHGVGLADLLELRLPRVPRRAGGSRSPGEAESRGD